MSGDWYTPSGAPSTSSQGSSATMRAELIAIETAMDKLPALTGNGNLPVFVNSGGTALEAVSAASARSKLSAQEDVITTRGDMIRGDSSGAAERVAIGAATYVWTSDGTDADWAAAASAISQATQAAIEAETDENTYIPPDLLKHNPGISKASVNFDGTAVTGAADLTGVNESRNIASVVDNGTGSYTVNFDTDFSNAYWRAAINVSRTSSDVNSGDNAGAVDKAVGSCRIDCENTGSGQVDMVIVDLEFFGDQ